MTPGSKGDDQNDAASSQSPTEETTAMKRHSTSTGALISLPPSLSSSSEPPGDSFNAPSLPTLPLDLVEEILCRLPVKFLLQFRCVCKSWNSLISDDSQFAKKHLRVSTTRHRRYHLILSSTNSSREKLLLWDSPIPSVFSSVPTASVTQEQLSFPLTLDNRYGGSLGVSTCDGILCFAINQCFPLLWNPSIRKFKILPPLENPRRTISETFYSFGYDHFSNNYKIVAVSSLFPQRGRVVNVHSLGTDYWRRIPDFPSYGLVSLPGIFVSGTVNWVAFDGSFWAFILSLDLKKESCQKLLRPNYQMANNDSNMTLGVWRDCLCILCRGDSDGSKTIWLMKEYGNQESWTKLFTIPHMGENGYWAYTKVIYISEDDQVLLEFIKSGKKLIVYDSRNGTFKIPEIQNINGWTVPEVYVESLISPF